MSAELSVMSAGLSVMSAELSVSPPNRTSRSANAAQGRADDEEREHSYRHGE
jgi:hypothetical protein